MTTTELTHPTFIEPAHERPALALDEPLRDPADDLSIRHSYGDLPDLVTSDRESRHSRIAFGVLATCVALLFFVHAAFYLTPAHPGVDQNGYLVGAKQFANTLSMRMAPTRPGTNGVFDPHQYVANMWVGVDYGQPTEAFYPKYPIGYPFLIAIVLWCSSADWGPILAYWINPVAMMFATLATFFLARRFMHSLPALLAMIVFATSPVTQALTSNPNSHATAVCCVACGMLALVSWWQRRGSWRAFTAGFLLGYACTIRYTEGTLILPIAFVALLNLRWRDWRSWRESGWLMFGWLVPVAALVAINYFTMGTITGYDQTNESSGFRLEYALDNWETLLRQLNTFGLAYVFPLSLAAIVCMFWWNWRIATWLTLWVGPCLVIYLAYYWAPNAATPDTLTISYTRFFLTIFPALTIAAFWLLDRVAVFANYWPVPVGAWRGGAVVGAWLVGVPLGLLVLYRVSDYSLFADLHGLKRIDLICSVIGIAAGTMAIATIVASIAAAILLGRSTLAPIGMVVLTAAVVLMQMEASMAQLDKNLIDQRNLQVATNEIRTVAPAGSVIFIPEVALVDQVQFFGDYRLYGGSTFSQPYVQGLATAREDVKDPQLLDPQRRLSLFNRLKNLDQKALDDEQRSTVEKSIDSNLRVFAIVLRRDGPAVSKKPQTRAQIAKEALRATRRPERVTVKLPDQLARSLGDKFETEVVATWNTLEPRAEPPGSFKPRGNKVRQPAAPMRWYQLLEITRKPEAPPAPAPAPKSAPAAPPAPKPMPVKVPASKPAVPAATPAPKPPVAPPPPASLPIATSAPATAPTPTVAPAPPPVRAALPATVPVPAPVFSKTPATIPAAASATPPAPMPAPMPATVPAPTPVVAPATAPTPTTKPVGAAMPATLPSTPPAVHDPVTAASPPPAPTLPVSAPIPSPTTTAALSASATKPGQPIAPPPVAATISSTQPTTKPSTQP